jgi:hypothetical protein
MKINKIALISSIIASISLLIYSTSKLINFAINQGAISRNESSLIKYIIDNYQNLNSALLIIILFSSIFIFIAYFNYFNENKQKIPKYILFALTLSFIFVTISQLSYYNNFFDNFSIKLNTSYFIYSIISIIFSISFIFYKKNRSNSLMIISPLLIVNSLFLISSIYINILLLDLSIAIKIAEGVFFAQQK